MQPLRATTWPTPSPPQVHQGRLVLDEPTDLPEGEVVYLQPVEGVVADADGDVADDERAALHHELEASIREADAGATEDFDEMLADLRKRA